MRRAALACILLAATLLLGGCWDNRPIENRALVLAIGFEPKGSQGYTIYFEIPTSQMLSGYATNSGSTGKGGSQYIVTGSGATISEAISAAQSKLSGDLYFGHVQVVALSMHLSGSQFHHTVNFLTRLGPLDKTAFAVAAADPVPVLLERQPKEGVLTPLYLNTLFSCERCQEVHLSRNLADLEQRMVTPGIDVWLPILKPSAENYRVDEVALYRDGVPTLVLPPQETVDFGFLTNDTAKASLNVPSPWGVVGIRALKASTAVHVEQTGPKLTLVAELKVKGTLDAVPPGKASVTELDALQREVSQRIADDEAKLLRNMQGSGVDAVGFLQSYLWQHPELVPHAREIYRTADVRVVVRTKIVDVGDTL